MAWLDIPINKLITVITVVASIIILPLIIVYAVCYYSEPGVIKVCWINGTAKSSTECKEPVDLVFDEKAPLSITSYNKLTDLQLRKLALAVSDINAQLRFNLFYIDENAKRANIYIEFISPPAADKVFHVKNNGSIAASIIFEDKLSSSSNFIALRRVLLKAVGLDYDTFEGSIMYPTNKESFSNKVGFQHITDYDKKLLTDLYSN